MLLQMRVCVNAGKSVCRASKPQQLYDYLFQLSVEINTANQKFPHLLTCFACFHRDLCRDLDLHHLNAFIT